MVCNWLKHDWETRKPHTLTLLKKVRLGLVSVDSLRELIDDDMLAVAGCNEVVTNVLQMRASRRSLTALAQMCPQMFTTRSTITVSLFVYLCVCLSIYEMNFL